MFTLTLVSSANVNFPINRLFSDNYRKWLIWYILQQTVYKLLWQTRLAIHKYLQITSYKAHKQQKKHQNDQFHTRFDFHPRCYFLVVLPKNKKDSPHLVRLGYPRAKATVSDWQRPGHHPEQSSRD